MTEQVVSPSSFEEFVHVGHDADQTIGGGDASTTDDRAKSECLPTGNVGEEKKTEVCVDLNDDPSSVEAVDKALSPTEQAQDAISSTNRQLLEIQSPKSLIVDDDATISSPKQTANQESSTSHIPSSTMEDLKTQGESSGPQPSNQESSTLHIPSVTAEDLKTQEESSGPQAMTQEHSSINLDLPESVPLIAKSLSDLGEKKTYLSNFELRRGHSAEIETNKHAAELQSQPLKVDVPQFVRPNLAEPRNIQSKISPEMKKKLEIGDMFLCSSQYSNNSVSSCTVMALEASLRVLYSSEITSELVQDAINFGSKYEDNKHTGVDDVFPKFKRYQRYLVQDEFIQDFFHNFKSLLDRVKRKALNRQASVAVILTKPPESLAVFFKYENGLLRSFLFDSHGRPEIWGPYAAIIAFSNPIALENFITEHIWSVLGDLPPDHEYNRVDATILMSRANVKIDNFASLETDDDNSAAFASLNKTRLTPAPSMKSVVADSQFDFKSACSCTDPLCTNSHDHGNRLAACQGLFDQVRQQIKKDLQAMVKEEVERQLKKQAEQSLAEVPQSQPAPSPTPAPYVPSW